jgi:FtsZ-binding cell division protein ZapB
MATTQNQYSQTRVDQLFRLLERHHQAGEAREYDILVDNIPVVPRTSNLSLFNAFEDEIQPDTRAITIRLYQGSSHNCDRYIFNMRGGVNGLDGVEATEGGLNGIIQKEINTKKLEWDHDKLKEEHDALKKEHHGLKSQFGKLESEYNSLQAQYSKMGMLGAVAGPFVDNLIGNSKLLKKTPLGQLLKPAEEIEAQVGSTGDASFSPADGLNGGLDPQMVEFCQFLEGTFCPAEFDQILAIVGQFAANKSLIGQVASQFQSQTTQANA